MEINLDHIHTYQACPLKYRFKYVDNIEMPEDKNTLFKRAIHKTVYYFFYSVMNGMVPTPKQMKDKWANTWEEVNKREVNPLELLLKVSPPVHKDGKQTRDTRLEKLNIDGLEMIHAFYHYNKDNPGTPIAVELDFRVPVAHNVVLTGKFELVREILNPVDKNRHIEIVDFKTGSDNNLDGFLVKNDFNLSVMSYAFRNLFQAEEDRMKYHYLKTGRDITTYRNENDHKRIKSVILGVAEGIDKKLYYPRQSFMCKACEFKDICNKTKF